MAFGPETSEFTTLTNIFAAIRQNRHVTPNISENPGLILTYFRHLVNIYVGIIILIFVRRSSKVRCYGNQLNLGAVRRRLQERPLLFALAFDNGFKMFNVNNPATSCANVLSIRPTVSEFTLLKRAIFGATRPQFDDRSSFATLAF